MYIVQYNQGPRHPRFKFNRLFNKHFLLLVFFFESVLSRENWRVGCGLLFKASKWWNLKLLIVITLDAIDGY